MPIATQTIVTLKDGSIPNHISAINNEPPASAKEDLKYRPSSAGQQFHFPATQSNSDRNSLASYPASFTARINDDAGVSPVICSCLAGKVN